MPKENVDKETRKPLPRWMIVALLVLCAAGAAAAMSMTGLRGPAMAWDRANKSIETVWAADPNATAANDPTKPLAQPAAATPVAAMPGVPVIVAGAPLIHADRGACTNCHRIVTQQNTAVPSITAISTMPHEYRGVCINCHQVVTSRAPIAPVAAAGNPAPFGRAQLAAGTTLGAPQPAAQPAEAEWQGLEVGPSPLGVMVNGAEGTARTAGVRAGDIVTSINGVVILTMADFVQATNRGALPQGAMIVRRDGQRLAFELRDPARNAPLPQAATPWTTTVAPRQPEVPF